MKQRSLDDVLASVADTLFPAMLGEAKINVHSVDCEGDTPLHVVARRRDLHAVRLLIEAGANVNAVGDMGEKPLHVAVTQEALEVVSLLIAHGARADIVSEFGDTAAQRAEKRNPELARAMRRAGRGRTEPRR